MFVALFGMFVSASAHSHRYRILILGRGVNKSTENMYRPKSVKQMRTDP